MELTFLFWNEPMCRFSLDMRIGRNVLPFQLLFGAQRGTALKSGLDCSEGGSLAKRTKNSRSRMYNNKIIIIKQ
jgi:hypothetical protein